MCWSNSKKTDQEIHESEDKYLNILSRGDLTVPDKRLAEIVNQGFSTLEVTEESIQKYNVVPPRRAAKYVLGKFFRALGLFCPQHEDKGKSLVFNTVTNIFYNNKQKQDCDKPEKDSITGFKKRQRIDQ